MWKCMIVIVIIIIIVWHNYNSLPYVIRLRQCISEYIESRGETKRHLYNALKYASAFPAIILSAVQKKVAIYILESGSVPTTWWINETNIFRLW